MENVSKALLIAGGILIGILILTVMATLFTSTSEMAEKVYNIKSKEEILAFNSQFEGYLQRDKITVQDVVTLINLAKDNNTKYGDALYITVRVNNVSGYTITETTNEDTLLQFIQQYSINPSTNEKYNFTCTLNYKNYFKDDTVRVSDVTVTLK